jgi:protein tyrosine phosphatase type 4A
MPFNDGGAPSDEVVNKWLNLLQTTYREETKETIGVHCVAGLGRAPVLVAIAMIESGMNALAAVEYIREKRRGSINMRQIQYLKAYKVRSKRGKNCIVM